jgi:hypothetical protein
LIDLRYHVYSLAAVFFALAIGIVVGSSFVGKSGDKEQLKRVEARYERALDDLKDEVYRQRDDIRSSQASLRRSEELCSTMMPVAMKSRLLYYNVAIIVTGDYDGFIPELKESLASVGANVTSVTRISSSLDTVNTDDLTKSLSDAGIVLKPNESPTDAVTRVVADAVVTAGMPDRIYALEDAGAVTLSGDYKRWNRNVVIIGGSSSDASKRSEVIDAPLIKRLMNGGARVVACEPFFAKTSSVSEWKHFDIATVDNVDRPSGRAALVCAIAGETAHFGGKSSADRAVPETIGGPKQ